jgi:hypothetical protein
LRASSRHSRRARIRREKLSITACR